MSVTIMGRRTVMLKAVKGATFVASIGVGQEYSLLYIGQCVFGPHNFEASGMHAIN
jgi:hypothetical protein